MSLPPKKIKNKLLSSGGLRPEDVAIRPKPSINAPGIVKRTLVKGNTSQSSSLVTKKPKLDFGGNQPELFSTTPTTLPHSSGSVSIAAPPPRPVVDYDDLKHFCQKTVIDEETFVQALNTTIKEAKYNKCARFIVAAFVKFVNRGQEKGKITFEPEIVANIARVVAQNAEKLTNLYIPKCIFACLAMSKNWDTNKQILLTSIVTKLAESQVVLPPYYAMAFLSDSLGERIWSDKAHCKNLVSLVLKRFRTKFPTADQFKESNSDFTESKSFWEPDDTVPDKFPADSEGMSEAERDREKKRRKREREGDNAEGETVESEEKEIPLRVNVVEDVMGYLRKWWETRSDSPNRPMLRTMAVFCGIPEVRVAAARRLDVWLQNPKVQRAALDLLLFVGQNIECARTIPSDNEAIGLLLRMKSLKSKQVQSVFNVALSAITRNEENARLALRAVITNELGPQNVRSPFNMTILQTMFAAENKKFTKLLAEELCCIVVEKTAMLKAACTFVRELVRSHIRNEFSFSRFLISFLEKVYAISTSGEDIDDHLTGTTASMCNFIVWVGVSPQVKDAFSQRRQGESYSVPVYTRFCQELNDYFESALKWLRQSRIMFDSIKEYLTMLYGLTFLDKGQLCLSVDGGPSEQEWAVCQRIISEVHPTQQLMKFIMADSNCEPPDLIQILDLWTLRFLNYTTPADNLLPIIENADVSILQSLFELCEFNNKPCSIPREERRVISMMKLYWDAWKLSYTWCVCGRAPQLMRDAYVKYPTLAMFMQMTVANDFSYPTLCSGLTHAESERMEKETVKQEQSEAARIESMLAGTEITVEKSHLAKLCCLTNPTGPPRVPSSDTLKDIQQISQKYSLGPRLCESRDPDLLVELVRKQGASKAMPSISTLLTNDASAVETLPVECLCEFLLYKLQHLSDADKDILDTVIARLRAAIRDASLGDDSVLSTTIFLLERLSSSNVRERRAVGQVLATIYSTDEDAMETEDTGSLCLRKLAASPHFESLRNTICIQLARACQLESDSGRVKRYLAFVNEHVHNDGNLHLIASYLSQLGHRADSSIRGDLIEFYGRYVDASDTAPFLSAEERLKYGENLQECSVVSEKGKFIMSPLAVRAQLELLCSSSVTEGGSSRAKLIDLWFPKSGRIPSVSVNGEPMDLFPEALRAKMLCTDDANIVNIALDGVSGERALRLLCRFGLTTHCAERLLGMLDELDFSKVDHSLTRSSQPFVIAYRGRGAKGGDKFLEAVRSWNQTAIKKEENDDSIIILEHPPHAAPSHFVLEEKVLSPKELSTHFKTLMVPDRQFTIGCLEMRSATASVQAGEVCLEQLEGHIKFFLAHHHAFHLVLLLLNAASDKFPEIRTKMTTLSGKLLKATQTPPNISRLLKKFAISQEKSIKKSPILDKAKTAEDMLAFLTDSVELPQFEQTILLDKYLKLRPEVVDLAAELEPQIVGLYGGTKNGVPWLIAQMPLVCSPETLRGVLKSVLGKYDARLNTASVIELLRYCACEGSGVVCTSMTELHLSNMILYMAHELVARQQSMKVIMEIIDSLVSVLDFNCLRTLSEKCASMIRSDMSLEVRDAVGSLLDKIEEQFPCIVVDRIRCSATIQGVHWRLSDADKRTMHLISTVFQQNSDATAVTKAVDSLNKILDLHPRVMERHLGVLSRLLAQLVSLNASEVKLAHRKATVSFAINAIKSLLPKTQSQYLEHIDAAVAVLIAYFERHLLGTRAGGPMSEQLLSVCLSYLNCHLDKARALLLEHAESLKHMCDCSSDVYMTRTIRDNIELASSSL